MAPSLLRRLWRRLGPRYPRWAFAAGFSFAHVVTFAGLGLLTIYQPMTGEQFWTLAAIAAGLMVVENAIALASVHTLLRPADPWLRGERTPSTARSAWRALAGLPIAFFTRLSGLPVVLNIVPMAVVITVYLALPWYAAFALCAGAAVVLLYGVLVRFFALEVILRPVLEDVSCDVPDTVPLPGARSMPLRWRLLLALPAINIITGVVVSGLSAGGQADLRDLGLDVLVAVVVAFTLSLELSLLLARSVLQPIGDLRRATDSVAAGDLAVRVPVVTADETGRLAAAFNEMVAGLQQRERLREAFGTYVDPLLAERVLERGAELEGEELEVSVLFLDIRDFTAFAERASAVEVVALLNGFFGRVVPVLVRHGGHASKFVGDGLVGVFGAPDPLPDHADRAVTAALEIATLVRRAYGDSLRIGIGVNSGVVVSGTIGGGGRLEYTVIGDAVNTAARVEEVTRQTGDDVLVTEATRQALRKPGWTFATRGTVPLKGKTARVGLHAPAADPGAVRAHLRAVGE